jgi:hypothetical protein
LFLLHGDHQTGEEEEVKSSERCWWGTIGMLWLAKNSLTLRAAWNMVMEHKPDIRKSFFKLFLTD